MKRFLVLLLVSFFFQSNAQKIDDPRLEKRLNDFMAVNRQMDFEKIIDFMHPKLFTLAPRNLLVQSMQKTFANEEMKFSFDSMSLVTITPVFNFEKSNYRKIDYYLGMTIKLSNAMDLKDEEYARIMKAAMEAGFPGKKIIIDSAENSIRVLGNEVMFAIQDVGSNEWMFLGYETGKKELVEKLYPLPVRKYFKLAE